MYESSLFGSAAAAGCLKRASSCSEMTAPLRLLSSPAILRSKILLAGWVDRVYVFGVDHGRVLADLVDFPDCSASSYIQA